ncbi:hypothetical protein PsYK624_085810 [Phanerochaete sordida]|uniref:Protein CPL1-like domain-containing protein n=1 Tax=Phanerochaete sordida TaxID=48140 RepID=A0A9P3LFV5_9APHY|nr:hypothetical protein PsYK624_085810 [Phanerochaete sordida]
MRSLTFIFALLATQLLPFAPAFANAKANRRYPSPTTPAPANDALASRQHHERRAVLDVCAYIDLGLGLGVPNLLGIPLAKLANLKLCLCLSALPLALDLNAQLKALGDQYGKDAVIAFLTALIDSSPNSRHCSYPDHCDPVCSAGDPCGYQCHAPYVKQGNKCVCGPGTVDCNGKCVPASQGCGSAVPRALSARSDSLTARAQASCKTSDTVCGIYGSRDSHAYECIDIQSNLESCGGCMAPNPFAPPNTSATAGRDCTDITGVDSVNCVRGACHVEKCAAGYAVNGAQDGCVAAHGAKSATHKSALKVQAGKRKPVSSRHFADRAEPEPENERHDNVYASAFYRE